MSSTSWKSYGGIYKTHKINNLGVGTIVTDRIIVRKQNIAVQTIEDNVIIEGYLETRGNSLATQNQVAYSSVFAGNSIFIDNRLLFINNLVNASIIDGEVAFGIDENENLLPVEDLETKYTNTHNYIGGNATSIGVGTDSPRNFFEIYENNDFVAPAQQNTETTIFSARSHRNITNSILISNQDDYSAGVKARAYENEGSIEFHASDLSSNGNVVATLKNSGSNFRIDNSTATGDIYIDAMTVYLQSDGTTKIDVSNNVLLSTQLSISNTDVSNSFLSEYYADASSNYQTTDAIVLNASAASANIFQHYVNTNNKGLSIGGGGFIENNTLSSGTLGLFTNNNSSSDSSFVPTITICEGTSSKIKNRTTLGVNTYSPNTNEYSLDINGKTRIGYGEIHVRVKPEFAVKSMSFSQDNLNYGMVVGTSLSNSDLSYNVFVTDDGGENWTMKEVVGDGTINLNVDNVLTVHLSGLSYAYILVERPSQNANLILYSKNKGDSWTRIQSELILTYKNIFGYFDDISHNIFTTSSDNDNKLYYYAVANSGIVYSDISGTYSTNHFIEDIAGINNNTIYSIGQHSTDLSGVIGKYIFDATNGGGIATYEKSFVGPTTFHRIVAYDENNVVAVGNDYIAYTNNGGGADGAGWNLLSNTGFNLHDVYLQSSQYGIAIGAGIIVYSNDYYASWKEVPNSLLNTSGMRTRLLNNLDTNSRLSMSSLQSMLISHVIGNTSSDVVYNYFPTMFNASENVLDVSGSIFVEGTITCGPILVGGAATIDNTLSVGGAATIDNTLSVGGAATIDNTLSVGGAVTCGQTLQF
jgi:hypothetical protein